MAISWLQGFGFECDLYRYTVAGGILARAAGRGSSAFGLGSRSEGLGSLASVGLCTLNQVDPCPNL
jgi:hypothetical protein